jgi:hypothetical protein
MPNETWDNLRKEIRLQDKVAFPQPRLAATAVS